MLQLYRIWKGNIFLWLSNYQFFAKKSFENWTCQTTVAFEIEKTLETSEKIRLNQK